MDLARLRTGEKVAGVAGIALLLIMFIFKWFGVEVSNGGLSVEGGTRNAWESFSFIDIILFLTALAAIGLAFLSASETDVSLPVAASAIVTALGVLSLILIIIRLISPPDLAAGGLSVSDVPGADVTRKIGVWLGLIAAAALTYGGYLAMQEEGTSFTGEADRFRDRGPGPGAGPPPAGPEGGPGVGPGAGPPPPPSSPPPGGPPPSSTP